MNNKDPNELTPTAEELNSPGDFADRIPFVLIFGTDKETRLLFKTALEIWQYDVEEAETVEQSVFIAEKRSPDVVLLDTELVVSNSLKAMKRMKVSDILKNAPFILFSGHSQKLIRKMAIEAGAADFMLKPVDFKLLEMTLKTYLDGNKRSKIGKQSA